MIRRIGYVCNMLARNGVVAISAAISPYREIRDEVRAKCGEFVEVHADPANALCDGPSSLPLKELPRLLEQLTAIRHSLEKSRRA